MKPQNYYYNCSPEYIDSIDSSLFERMEVIINQLPKRQVQAEINADLFWLLTSDHWNYDTVPKGAGAKAGVPLSTGLPLDEIKQRNTRKLCLTSTTLNTLWHTDFAKSFGSNLVHIEAQFGKVEAMFKDFCGFRIAYAERRLALGIEIVLSNPTSYFAHRKNAIGGMANFEIAKGTLTTIGLDCPIWLIGMNECFDPK
jgi:hypothetical protein